MSDQWGDPGGARAASLSDWSTPGVATLSQAQG